MSEVALITGLNVPAGETQQRHEGHVKAPGSMMGSTRRVDAADLWLQRLMHRPGLQRCPLHTSLASASQLAQRPAVKAGARL